MAPPQERDYIGLLPATAATELRLGLPGTEDAEGGDAVAGTPLTLELLPKGGAKRGFADAIVRRDAAATGKAPADDEEVDKKKAQAPAAKYVYHTLGLLSVDCGFADWWSGGGSLSSSVSFFKKKIFFYWVS